MFISKYYTEMMIFIAHELFLPDGIATFFHIITPTLLSHYVSFSPILLS